MKIVKRTALWLALMLAIAVIVDVLGSIVCTLLVVNSMDGAYIGYSKQAEKRIVYKINEVDEKNNSNGLAPMILRVVMDDDSWNSHNSLLELSVFTDLDIDESHIFFTKDITNEFSKGIFALVYEDTGISVSYVKTPVGLIDINEFIKLDSSSDFFTELEKNKDATIRVDAYSIDNFTVTPSKLTILDENGNALRSFEFPTDGKIIEKDNIYIKNKYDKHYTGYGVYNKMKTAYKGERKVDRIARDLVPKAEFSQGKHYETNHSYGFASIYSKHVETYDDSAYVYVMRFSFISSFLFYTAIFGLIMTVIFILKCRKKDKEEWY